MRYTDTAAREELVSVIVPAYGHERFVAEALASVSAQSYGPIELIVIDDCSKDATFARIMDWVIVSGAEQRFNRVLTIRNPENQGAHNTINHGLQLANGNYISLLNSDDMYAPTRIASLVSAARNTGSEFIFTGIKVIDDSGKRMSGQGLQSQIEFMADIADAFPSISYSILSRNIAISTGNFFFTKNMLQRVGPLHNYKLCHDWDFILRASLLTEPTMIRDPLYFYRIHGENTFKSLTQDAILEPVSLMHDFFQMGKKGHCRNPLAPLPENWPSFFDFFAANSSNIKWLLDAAGSESINITKVLPLLLRTS